MNQLRKITDLSNKVFGSIPAGKRAMIVGMIATSVIITIALLFWAFRPQYRILYSDLSLRDSADIVQVLQENNIDYRLEQEGQRVLVQSKKLYDTRLLLAEQELPGETGVGWELFDKTNLGVTDFVQKLNYRRGLEGELARTILQLDPIDAVRVHLALPEESLFKENQKETVASVTLRLRGGKKLSQDQVEGITYLVSSAVEGLNPENVTVVDSKGVILSERTENNPVIRLSASQLEIQRKYEHNLVTKGQSLLDKRFGMGRSAIQATVELDFERIETTREFFDADNPATRSEEITSNQSTGADTSIARNETTVTNYELGKTLEHRINPIGQVKRMSIAVMVDGKYETITDPASGKERRDFVAIPQQELDGVSDMIKSALGFNVDRGDDITVLSVPFQEASLIGFDDFSSLTTWDLVLKYSQKGATVIAILLMLLMVRNFMKKSQVIIPERKTAPPQLKAAPSLSHPTPEIEAPRPFDELISPEVRSAAMLKEQVTNFIKDKPDAASKLVKTWLID